MNKNEGTYLEPRYQEAVAVAKKYQRVTADLICARLTIGYNHACRLIDAMLENGDTELKIGKNGREYHWIERP